MPISIKLTRRKEWEVD